MPITTRYEPAGARQREVQDHYEVTATRRATRYFNPIRRGSVATDESVLDRMTGQPCGSRSCAAMWPGPVAWALIRPASTSWSTWRGRCRGVKRILIDKTYEDATSYMAGGDTLVFNRPLGIKKNSVVLPAGYELISVNYPSQVRQEADGRIQVSFINVGTAQVPYIVKARKLK
jgi:hypothetical protein